MKSNYTAFIQRRGCTIALPTSLCQRSKLFRATPFCALFQLFGVIEFPNGQSVCGHLRMGLRHVETGFLSCEAGCRQVSWLLRNPPEFRGTELHVPPLS